MARELIISNVEFNQGYVFLRINNKGYKYKFGDTLQINKALYESYWTTFGRNKGRFLSKIRSFQMKETNGNIQSNSGT